MCHCSTRLQPSHRSSARTDPMPGARPQNHSGHTLGACYGVRLCESPSDFSLSLSPSLSHVYSLHPFLVQLFSLRTCSDFTWTDSSPQQHISDCTWAPSGRRLRPGCSTDQVPDQGDLRRQIKSIDIEKPKQEVSV